MASCLLLVAAFAASATAGSLKVGVVHADVTPSADGLVAKFNGLGLFAPIGPGDVFDVSSATPGLGELSGYDVLLAYSNYAIDDPAALGDVLADFVDLGKGVVLAEYSIGDVVVGSGGTAVGGRFTTTGYAPLVISSNLGDVSGSLVASIPADPIFAGVDLSNLQYFHNANFAQPALDAGATLLATDGNGVNMIARSASGRILGMNLFPGTDPSDNNDEFYDLLGNAILDVAPGAAAVPEPGTLGAAAFGALALAIRSRRRHAA